METQREKTPEEKEERKIPVLTVLKNGSVIKNIFVINTQPPSPSAVSPGSGSESITSVKNAENPDQETGEILIVGRHPDCNIVLMHPSISRFHLQINSKPSSQRLFVTDLSSGKKIEPGVRVELRESDTIRVGGSTRLYKLHWVPLSSAYDMENPCVLPQDVSMIEEIEEEYELLEKGNELNMCQDENSAYDMENPCVLPQDVSMIEEIEEECELLEKGNELNMCQDENLLPAGSIHVNVKDAAMVEEIESALIFQDNYSLATEVKPVEETVPLEVAGIEQGAYQEMNSVENGEIQALNSVLDGILPLFSDENCGFIAREDVPMAPLVPEKTNSSLSDETEEIEGQSANDNELGELLNSIITREASFMAKTQKSDERINRPAYHFAKEAIPENGSVEGSLRAEKESNCLVNLDSSLSISKLEASPAMDIAEQTTNQCLLGTTNKQLFFHPLVTENVNFSLPFGTVLETSKKINEEDRTQNPHCASQPLSEEGKRQNSIPHHATPQTIEEVENQLLSEKHDRQTEFPNVCCLLLAAESVNSSFPVKEILSGMVENKEAQSPQSVFGATEKRENSNDNLEDFQISSETIPRSCNIWSRRGKTAAALQLQTRSIGKNDGPAEAEWENQGYGDNRLTAMPLCSASKVTEEGFTPETENYRPNNLLLKSLRRKGKPDETQTPKSCARSSSNVASSPSIHLENVITLSDKENQTPKCLRERKSTKPFSNYQRKLDQVILLRERRAERLPLQSLLADSPGKSMSEVTMHSAAKSSVSVQNQNPSSINSVLDGKRRWTMVADTSSLLDKKSRMALQLLHGLKGTQLIIPRMVIRELDCLKWRGSLFRKTSEASVVLEWIEECMSKTKWWIHVQSSVDDRRLTAPTPTASPQSRFSQGSGGFPCGTKSSAPFSAYVSLLEIASPTAEDHILDYALSYRKMNNNGQLVLISNNVTLKIKAMAEGLSCETAQEFRDSLVNPFSERFLWADSSPRGQTWSVLDDVVLKEWFYQNPSKTSSKGETAKGLKLILLHNSHYGQKNDVVNTV